MDQTNKNSRSDELALEVSKAEACFTEGNLAKALDHYAKALAIDPLYAEGHCNSGMIYAKIGEMEKAENSLKQSLKLNPNLSDAYFNLGIIHHEKGDFDTALIYYKEAILREPKDAQAFARMGECAVQLERKDDAVALYEEAFRLLPNHYETALVLSTLYIEKKLYEKAEDMLHVALVSHPEEAELYFVLGLVLKEQGKMESALAQFNNVVTRDENHAQGFFHLAQCCEALDLFKQAEPFYAKAYKLNALNHQAVYHLAKLYEKKKKADSAVTMYRQWIDMIEPGMDTQNAELNELYQHACGFLADYFKNSGDTKQADIYSSKISRPESDYQVSLEIDD